jgi:hypothetical protein
MANYLLGKGQFSFHVIYPHITWKLRFQGPRRRSERRWGSGRWGIEFLSYAFGKVERYRPVFMKLAAFSMRSIFLPNATKAPFWVAPAAASLESAA